MTDLPNVSSGQGISTILKSYMAKEESKDFFIDKSEAHAIISLIDRIGVGDDGFLVTTDPFDNYGVTAMSFGSVVRIICEMMKHAQDIRIFGKSWAVGISSYSSNAQSDNETALSLDDLEMKISLIGTATSWPIEFSVEDATTV